MSNPTLTSFEKRALVLAQLILSTEEAYIKAENKVIDFSEALYREYKRQARMNDAIGKLINLQEDDMKCSLITLIPDL